MGRRRLYWHVYRSFFHDTLSREHALRKMAQHKRSAQQVRIIGGKWKGRKLHFDGGPNLRPTLGRTRETLFNWLRPHIPHSRCLDAFAGSGALGFEALSQGAQEVVFVEQDLRSVRALKSSAERLGADTDCTIVNTDALRYLNGATSAFDIVFLDPPFDHAELLLEALAVLAQTRLVRQYVYAEARNIELVEAVAGFELVKQTRAGDTAAALLAPRQDIAGNPSQG